MSIEELDKLVDEILSKAEKEKERIIQEARRIAAEILKKPIPVEQYKHEAEELIKKARLEAEKIIQESLIKSNRIKEQALQKLDEVVDFIVKIVAGLDK